MAQIKISDLPLYTGNTSGSFLIMNNSGETTTFKVSRENIIGASGTSGTSGTSGSSGVSGTAGTSGDSIFAQTGSFWNTTRDVGITGSFNVNGTTLITGSLNVTGSVFVTGSINNRIYNVPIVSNTASLDLSQSNIQFVTIPSSSLGVTTVFVTATNINSGWSGVVRVEGQGASTSGFVTGSTGFILDSTKFINGSSAEYLSGSSRLGTYTTFTNTTLMLAGTFIRFDNTVGK
jgi:hypothetical protein